LTTTVGYYEINRARQPAIMRDFDPSELRGRSLERHSYEDRNEASRCVMK